jgi:cytochrome c5
MTVKLPAFVVGVCLSTAISALGIKSEEQVYAQVCFACHVTGVENAPKFGDKAAWYPLLLKEGQYVVTAHGWVGQRGMPARGGRADLS